MPATMLVGQALAETLIDAIKASTVNATITTAANVVLWTAAVTVADVSETDGLISITTAAATASATGTPAKVKFYSGTVGAATYAWRTTIGNGGSFGFQLAGDITSGNQYQFTASPISFTISGEND